MPNSVFFNTAEKTITFTLLTGDGEIMQASWESQRDDTEKVPAELQKLLRRADATLSDVNELFVCSGPGPFTGIRIGVVMANVITHFNHAKMFIIEKSLIPDEISAETFSNWRKTIKPVTHTDAIYANPVEITKSKKEPLIPLQ